MFVSEYIIGMLFPECDLYELQSMKRWWYFQLAVWVYNYVQNIIILKKVRWLRFVFVFCVYSLSRFMIVYLNWFYAVELCFYQNKEVKVQNSLNSYMSHKATRILFVQKYIFCNMCVRMTSVTLISTANHNR